ncbi:sugar transferase [Agromyces sp. MMS24-JH15]|uniref:sugar transferase n=1 Tax=Agromyces sp. MMS24-JH15 TaxID=3243765 RepID=UPI003748598E
MSTLPTPADPTDGGRFAAAARVVDGEVIGAASGARARERYRDRVRVTDSIVVVAAVLGSVSARQVMTGPADESIVWRLGVPLFVTFVWLCALAAFRTRDSHITAAGATEYKRVANATIAAFGLIAFALVLSGAPGARFYLLVALPAGGIGLLCGRWLWRRWLLAQRRYGQYLSRAVVVGPLADITRIIRQMDRSPAAGFRVVGIVSDDIPTPTLAVDSRELPVLAGIGEAARAAAEWGADAVVVTGDLDEDGSRLRRLGWELEGTGAELVLPSRLTDVAGPRIHFRPVEGLPLLHVEIPTFSGPRHTLKRAFDIVFASVALILIAPVMLATAIAIRLEDGGPVFFVQTRCGRDGRTFRMFKFRSMVVDAEARLAELADRDEGAGPLFKLHDDPRVTRIGRLIRAYSIDELPQFWNVLIGDMSVVGPRPPLEREAAAYDGVVSRRLMIKPGLTGLWQISGRSDLDWEESVRLDLYYVENWSLTGDLMIIWRTIRTVLAGDGAY